MRPRRCFITTSFETTHCDVCCRVEIRILLQILQVVRPSESEGPACVADRALAPLVGRIAGIERRAIRFETDGLKRTVRAGDLIEQACEGVASGSVVGQAICIDNTVHPVNNRLSLAKALFSKFNVFCVKWIDSSGTRNGHFAPFAWSG
ncbi:MAG: DUF1326 domain-containing protein [Caldimonas sp.]